MVEIVRETPRRLRLCSLILIVPRCGNAPVWDVGWDWPRIDVMETGLFRLVTKRQFATDVFRRRNCIGKHYCDPSGNSFPPNCTPESLSFVPSLSPPRALTLSVSDQPLTMFSLENQSNLHLSLGPAPCSPFLSPEHSYTSQQTFLTCASGGVSIVEQKCGKRGVGAVCTSVGETDSLREAVKVAL